VVNRNRRADGRGPLPLVATALPARTLLPSGSHRHKRRKNRKFFLSLGVVFADSVPDYSGDPLVSRFSPFGVVPHHLRLRLDPSRPSVHIALCLLCFLVSFLLHVNQHLLFPTGYEPSIASADISSISTHTPPLPS
jgi:hypothetical protein